MGVKDGQKVEVSFALFMKGIGLYCWSVSKEIINKQTEKQKSKHSTSEVSIVTSGDCMSGGHPSPPLGALCLTSRRAGWALDLYANGLGIFYLSTSAGF